MHNNVVFLHETTSMDLPPDRVLEQAIGELENVVVIGYAKDGSEYFASSIANIKTVNWLLDRFKLTLLNSDC